MSALSAHLDSRKSVLWRCLLYGTLFAIPVAWFAFRFSVGPLLLLLVPDVSLPPVPFWLCKLAVTAYLVFVSYFSALSMARKQVDQREADGRLQSHTTSLSRKRWIYIVAIALVAPGLAYLVFYATPLGALFIGGYPRGLHALLSGAVFLVGAFPVMVLTRPKRGSDK